MIETLVKILNNLNSVEVKGKTNLNYQLGAIQGIEKLIMEQSKKEAKSDGNSVNA